MVVSGSDEKKTGSVRITPPAQQYYVQSCLIIIFFMELGRIRIRYESPGSG